MLLALLQKSKIAARFTMQSFNLSAEQTGTMYSWKMLEETSIPEHWKSQILL